MDEDDGHNADNLIQQWQRQQQVMQQQLNTEERLKLIFILQQKYTECPFRTKKKIDRLVDTFLEELEDDIHHLLCNMKDDGYYHAAADDDDSDDSDDSDSDDSDSDLDVYCGLDSDRDTTAEVETAIRLFPRILSRGGSWDGYPIHHLSYITNDSTHSFLCNLKAHSFIPLVARLAIEFGSFEEHECGGLLTKERNGRTVLNWLMLSDHNSETLTSHEDHEDHVELVDNQYLQVLVQLRRMGLLKKKDIRNCNLIYSILYNGGPGFSERRFRFVVEWDPTSLLQERIYDYEIRKNTCIIPLHHAALNSYIHVFQFVFEYGIRYFPKKKGINLLFKINENEETPFRLACNKFGYEEVMRVIEESLIRCYSLSLDNSPPLNIVEALLMAATDESVHLDCVYFLLRRQPDVLIKPLSVSINNNNNNGNGNDNNSYVGDGDDGDDDGGGNNRENEDESVGDSAEYDGNDTSIRDNANQDEGNAATKRSHSRNGNGKHVHKEDEEIPNSLIDRKRKREI